MRYCVGVWFCEDSQLGSWGLVVHGSDGKWPPGQERYGPTARSKTTWCGEASVGTFSAPIIVTAVVMEESAITCPNCIAYGAAQRLVEEDLPRNWARRMK